MESGRGATRHGTLTPPHSSLLESFLVSDKNQTPTPTPTPTTTTTTTTTGANSLAGLTLAAVLNNERRSPIVTDQSNSTHIVRTLLDIIRNEEILSNPNTHFVGKKTWKSFKDRLNLRRLTTGGTNWASSVPVPQSNVEVSGGVIRMMSRRNSLRNNSIRRAGSGSFDGVPAIESLPMDERSGSMSMRLSTALAAEREETRRRLSRELVRDEDPEEEEEEDGEDERDDDEDEDVDEPEVVVPREHQPMRMSLMDLLEETDRQAGIQGPTYRLNDEEEEEEEEEEEGVEEEEELDEVKGGALGKGEYSCCVCMVRHKGAAFIPCGHTFCRLCSRELWVQRGNCPLCNGFILEVLDIF
ncbi:hypothetical protein Dimus_032586 [Dionaea muscipula]